MHRDVEGEGGGERVCWREGRDERKSERGERVLQKRDRERLGQGRDGMIEER